jgi:hypothetical protein
MAYPLSGPGVGLPYAQYLYPTELTNAPVDFSSNRLALAPGDAIVLPRGTWYVDPGLYCVVQYKDPANGQWDAGADAAYSGSMMVVSSDGFTCRVANMTGCVVAAGITGAGSSFAQTTATISPSVGSSTWSPIIGGALSVTTIANPGSGYGVAPLVLIPAPAPPSSNPNSVGGISASAYTVLTAGTVSAISWTNQGAGYNVAPTATIVPNPTDPNINSGITPATITIGLTGAGTLTGAICTNPGRPLTSAEIAAGLTLTAAGGSGTGATLSAVIMQTVTALTTVSTAGTGYPTTPKLTTSGGVPAATALVTPSTNNRAWKPRAADIALATAGGSIVSISAIYDGGLFEGTPSPIIVGGAPTTAAVVTLTMGSVADHVILQPTG